MNRSVKSAQKMYDWALALHTEKRTFQSEKILKHCEVKLNEALTKAIKEAA
jgi:hypothetical protein